MDDRIPTDLWVSGIVRQCAAKGMPVYVLRRGAQSSGTLMVKTVLRGQGARLYSQTRDMEGKTAWLDVFEGEIVDEKRADDYIGRCVSRDPDLWCVEVEDASGANPFEGKII